jgi:IS1 family transposase
VALDPEHKLVLEVVNGKRTAANTRLLVRKTAKRLKNRVPRMITSDEYKPYKKAIGETWGVKRTPKRTGKRGRPRKPRYRPKPNLVYATVHKTRVKGRVTKIDYRIIFGTPAEVADALSASRCSRHINTAFVERQNGTDRNRCSRKTRQSYCFSKNWDIHRAATCFSMYSYNFCWPVRTLRRPSGHPGPCTPAMAAGLADHVWTIREWLEHPVCK